jgi:hypothetical protein
MIKLYKGHSIDAAYQVSIHLAKRFQIRREDCLEINQSETRIPEAAMLPNGSERNEHSL